jgi:mRNA-degrading endonuclease RelE of RelBE toxin-antitoxin system
MNCKVIAIPSFRKDAKRLLKKYVSLKRELSVLGDQLLLNPRMGILLHENTYKIKIAVKSKGKGKSGGLRVISHVVELEVAVDEDETQQTVTVFLLTIYDKSEMENISDGDLKWLVAEASAEVGGE